jgi:hypothetical protein
MNPTELALSVQGDLQAHPRPPHVSSTAPAGHRMLIRTPRRRGRLYERWGVVAMSVSNGGLAPADKKFFPAGNKSLIVSSGGGVSAAYRLRYLA